MQKLFLVYNLDWAVCISLHLHVQENSNWKFCFCSQFGKFGKALYCTSHESIFFKLWIFFLLIEANECVQAKFLFHSQLIQQYLTGVWKGHIHTSFDRVQIFLNIFGGVRKRDTLTGWEMWKNGKNIKENNVIFCLTGMKLCVVPSSLFLQVTIGWQKVSGKKSLWVSHLLIHLKG